MSLWTESGQRFSQGAHMRVVDLLCSSRTLLGPRCWGMVHLYYRAGLSHQEIADIFGLSRQAVTGQLRRAFRLLVWAVLTRRPEVAAFTRDFTDEERLQALALLGEDFDPDAAEPGHSLSTKTHTY